MTANQTAGFGKAQSCEGGWTFAFIIYQNNTEVDASVRDGDDEQKVYR